MIYNPQDYIIIEIIKTRYNSLIKFYFRKLCMLEEEFEEDIEPTWLTKQREDALLTEKAYSKNEKHIYKEGDQVGNFLFVKYNKFKNRATYQCQECGRKFTYNIYAIKNKKRCKWYKFHT